MTKANGLQALCKSTVNLGLQHLQKADAGGSLSPVLFRSIGPSREMEQEVRNTLLIHGSFTKARIRDVFLRLLCAAGRHLAGQGV